VLQPAELLDSTGSQQAGLEIDALRRDCFEIAVLSSAHEGIRRGLRHRFGYAGSIVAEQRWWVNEVMQQSQRQRQRFEQAT